MKRFLILLLIMPLLAACSPPSENLQVPSPEPASPTPTVTPEQKDPLEITVLKLDKADAILIELSGRAMLIDTGETGDGSKIAALLRDRRITRLDYIILSHSDKDHIGGLARVYQEVPVTQLIVSHHIKDSEEYLRYLETVSRYGLQPITLREEMTLEFAGALVRNIPAREDYYEDDNNYSIMTEITYGSHRFLFAGDAETARLEEYLQGDPQPFDFVKMPHHGRKSDNSVDFINAISPKYAVITCEKRKDTAKTVTNALNEVGAETFFTSDGLVTVISDGTTLTVKQNKT